MTNLQAIILGLVQGLTEFLPISSSAHLVLVPWLVGWDFEPQAAFAFDVLVQMGTLLAVIVYFWRDLWQLLTAGVRSVVRWDFSPPDARRAWLLVLATLPAALSGALLRDLVSEAFARPIAVGGFLLTTAAFLLLAESRTGAARTLTGLTWIDTLVIGIAQAFALFPGISRSGSTIGAGLLCGLDRRSAARFSFLMSIPIMIGAGLFEARHLVGMPNFGELMVPIALGFVVAAIVGFLAIRWLLGYLAHRSLRVFSLYCAIVGMLTLVIGMVR
jgi:undecaprenyl-diphosphatase